MNIRKLRLKSVAELAVFLLTSAAVLQVLVYLANRPQTVSQVQGPRPVVAQGISARRRVQSVHAKLAQQTKNTDNKDKLILEVINSTSFSVIKSPVATPLNAGVRKTDLNVNKESVYISSTVQANKPQLVPKIKPTVSGQDPFENISQPYYTIIKDERFHIDRSYFRLRPTRVSTVTETFPISSSVCSRQSPGMLFIVPSVASSKVAKERLEIRRTWASSLYGPSWRQDSSTRLAFFFGGSGLTANQLEELREESLEYGDIVVGDFLDSYHNLSLKMAVVITWVARNCPDIKAAIKIDMDTYVNIRLLFGLMKQLPTKTSPNYVFGHRHGFTQPLVVRSGQWAVPQTLYPFDLFPRYIYGHSYVISGPAVKLMAESFPFFPIVPNEDAFATGIITVTLNITRFHHDSFAYLLEKRTLCDMTRGFHVTAVMKAENRMKLWDAFHSNSCITDAV